jgi:hypothetical protein
MKRSHTQHTNITYITDDEEISLQQLHIWKAKGTISENTQCHGCTNHELHKLKNVHNLKWTENP